MRFLSSYPRVFAEKDWVIIEYSNGKQYLWGQERSAQEARNVADVLDIELKVLDYVQHYMGESITTLKSSLSDIITDKILNEIINDVILQYARKS